MSKHVHVGLIGVGLMGHGIATSLLRAGHRLTFLDHPGNQPTDDLRAKGATAVARPRDVATAAEVVILCVTGTPQVESVLFDEGGVIEGIGDGREGIGDGKEGIGDGKEGIGDGKETIGDAKVIIDCSTAIPSSTRGIAERVAAAGGRFMDAAMTRTPKEAAEGRLNLIVGAPEALFDAVRPLLASFSEHITHGGPVGSGHTLKLLHNFVSLGFTAVLAEAVAASRRAEIDDAVLLEVLGNGGGGGVVLERLRPFIACDDPSGFRFSLANSLKDVGYYQAMAGDLDAAKDVADAVASLYRQVNDQGHGERLVPELVTLLKEGA
ncbi:NAD(P)-dependent oxidoreductase [Halomonas sp. V046]|uniref:NAD(P)-dependent oxidoreductase n=1 Tax=Halomonas sp. V046 TaxID=3459611 RepID=UPI00404491C2